MPNRDLNANLVESEIIVEEGSIEDPLSSGTSQLQKSQLHGEIFRNEFFLRGIEMQLHSKIADRDPFSIFLSLDGPLAIPHCDNITCKHRQ